MWKQSFFDIEASELFFHILDSRIYRKKRLILYLIYSLTAYLEIDNAGFLLIHKSVKFNQVYKIGCLMKVTVEYLS